MSLLLKLLVFIVLLVFETLQDIAILLYRSANYIILKIEKLIVLFAPVVVYNIIDNLYNITPKITMYAIGVFQQCLSLLSSETLTQLIETLPK